MKKAIIGMAAGAMALGASVVPVSAGYGINDNLWDVLENEGGCNLTGGAEGTEDIFEQLVLSGGWASRLDTDGNGKPRYTIFQPEEAILEGLLDALGVEISDLNDVPSTVQAILADHIANGSFSEEELEDSDLTRITMRSGYVASVFSPADIDPNVARQAQSDIGANNVYVAGALILSGTQADNGWRYCIAGWVDSRAQVSHEGLNSEDTPNDGTPGGTNSLPDTL